MRYKNFEYEIINHEVRIKKYLGNEPIVIVPANMDNDEVTVIGTQAFYGNMNLDLLILLRNHIIDSHDYFFYWVLNCMVISCN